MEFHHVSVLLEETIQGLVTNPDGIYVDCTLGGAGHSSRIAAKLTAAGRLIGTNKAVTEGLERVEHWLVPAVFIGLGLFILIESGVIVRLIEVLA